ncbi:MAG: glycosyltransferase [Candidatus Krumholzibacteriia bacterium]
MVFFAQADPERVRPQLVLLGDNPTFSTAAEGIGGLPVHRLGPRGVSPLRPDILARYARLVRRERIDLVHLFGLRQELATRWLSRLAGVPLVVSGIRGMETHRSALQCRLNRWTGRWVDLWISNSEATRDLFVRRDGLPRERIVVIPNGVAVPGRLPDRQQARQHLQSLCSLHAGWPVVGCVANLLAHKRQEDLLAAVAALRGADRHVDVILAGRPGGHADAIRRTTDRLGLGDRVHVLGYRSDVREFLPAFDVFVLPSEKEGLPAAVLEAMAMGVPVVATDVADTPRLVADGATGWIVPVGDIDVLVARLRHLLDDPQTARRFGEAGWHRACDHYSDAAMTESLIRVYRTLVRDRGA